MEPRSIYVVTLQIRGLPLNNVAAYTNLTTLKRFINDFCLIMVKMNIGSCLMTIDST